MALSVFSRIGRISRLNRLSKGITWFGFVALLALTVATAQIASAQIASGSTGIDVTGNARSEMAACESGATQQAKDTCMTEVRNANAEKRAGKLENGADFNANAMKRCEVFTSSSEQADCRERLLRESKAQGSVANGGVLRESETVTSPAAK